MDRSSFSRRCYKLISALAIAALLATNSSRATELVLETGEFLITRDFQRFTIPASAAVFFKTKTAWGAEMPDTQIRDETRKLLASSLSFVENPAEAQYELHVRLEEYTDYAVRNRMRRPAQGFVMFAICALPFKEASERCQNLTFYYFESQPRLTMFRRATDAWRAMVIR